MIRSFTRWLRRPAMRSALAAGSVVLASAAASAQDTRHLTEIRLKERAGHFLAFFPPRYPDDALRAGTAATLDVFGTVQADGSFRLERVESESPAPGFEEAVRKVVRHWSMRPGYDARCDPVAAPAQAKLWFEVRDGYPVVAFAQPVDPAAKDDPPLRLVHRPAIDYPQEERRAGRERTVEAILRVRPDGSTEQVRVVAGAVGRRFAWAVEEALIDTRFEPTGVAEPLCALYTVDFRLKD